MNRNRLAPLVCAGVLCMGCSVAARPAELARAHRAYNRALNGMASTMASPDLEPARLSLAAADRAFADHDVDAARDLAIIALRRIELAEARAEETLELEADSSFAAQSAAR
jgi:hypothetical protein